MSQTFDCKRCAITFPVSFEVVTRYRTKTCKRCWGHKVHRGHVLSKQGDVKSLVIRGTS